MRDLEGWKRALVTLPGDRFLVLIRNYLGEIRTPYNKQDLIRQLAAFLADHSVQERIVALVDSREALVLTALMLLGPVSLESLSLVFAGRIGLLALGEMLANLEERLLVYRERIEVPLVDVNPILEPLLRSRVFDSGALFSWKPSTVAGSRPPLWVSDAALLAVVSLLCAGGIPQKKGGGLRKRDLATLATIFPSGPGDSSQGQGIERALAALLPLLEAQDLVADDGRPRVAAWRSLAARSAPQRAAALLAPLLGPGVRPDLAAHVVGGCLAALAAQGDEEARAFDAASVQSLCALLALRGAPGAPEAAGAAAQLVSGLRSLNVLVESGEGLALHPDAGRRVQGSRAVVQPNFDVTFPGGASLEDALDVALAGEARRVETAVVFELTRGSFQRYLDLGGSADRLLEVLEALTGQAGPDRAPVPLPQNVIFSLRTWEREYRRLALYEGVVLIADEEHQYLLDNSPLLRQYVRRKIAPGVYLLAAADRDAWMAALRRSGVEHVPEIVAIRAESGQKEPAAELPFEGPLLGADMKVDIAAPRPPREAAEASAGSRAALLDQLADMGLADDDASEIRVRIERGLILVASQLRPLATEKGEARGLDYLGKVRLIERAIERGALVELLERGPSGVPRRILARPQRLEKSASGLILAAEALPDGEALAISVSRLSRVRLVMRSLLD